MNNGTKSGKNGVEERILASAATLFADFGYNGVSMRYIASRAKVNEVTIYRHYSRKRDLYVAVLDAELKQVKLGGDLLARIAEASDARTVLVRTFELLSATLLGRPELVRLIQYSALELGEDIDPLLRKYLSELVEVVVRYLEPWVEKRPTTVQQRQSACAFSGRHHSQPPVAESALPGKQFRAGVHIRVIFGFDCHGIV